MIIDEDEYLRHYGTPRHSGRYPWGSGGQVEGIEDSDLPRNASFLDTVAYLTKKGLSPKEIAEGMGLESTTRLRSQITIERNAQRQARISQAQKLRDKGMSYSAIAEKMGLAGESSARQLLAPGAKDKADVLIATADMLQREVDTKNAGKAPGELSLIDVGSGVESYVNISKEKLGAAVAILEAKGYVKHQVKVPQRGTGKDTTYKVLTPPGTTWGEAQRNRFNIQQIEAFSQDGGLNYTGKKKHEPIAINPKRVKVKYGSEGGRDADGVIYLREGVEDLSLGKSRYAQVRIKVGKDRFLKGMAMYKDDLPPGVDLMFNTNKESTGNDLDAMKTISPDPDYPFESVVRPIIHNIGAEDEYVTSAVHIVNEEGDWGNWAKSLSSQVLSKQSPSLAKEQLNKTRERRQQELDEITSLTNPTVRKKLFEKFADSTDSAAVELHAAALSSRQAWHAILPIQSLPPTQVYAPNYDDGELVALIRFPHGGKFEIPELIVNNRHRESKKLLGDAPDAIGIHPSVAQRLSGADFDGDTVIVIPNNRRKIRSDPALEGLKKFDPRSAYRLPDDSPWMTSSTKAQQMGEVSNLITDMTLRLAPNDHIVRAVKHSMVVIDAEKHHLDYKQSAIDFNIKQLKTEYQGGPRAGASTLISRRKSEDRVPHRKPRPYAEGGPVDKKTGRKMYVPSGKTRYNKETGERVPLNERVRKLASTEDAHSLTGVIPTPIERIYADHSNALKGMANKARLLALKTPSLKMSASAKKTYAKEVSSLKAKLAIAKMNRPRERQAQVIANAAVKIKVDANPHLDRDSIKKIGFEEQEIARARLGVKRRSIEIIPSEWDAIQAGAISNSQLGDILDNTDLEAIKVYATPRTKVLMTSSKTARARRMLSTGATRAEVAKALGVSVSTLDRSLA